MALKAALTWLCLISGVSFSGAAETSPMNCDSALFMNLTAGLKMVAECEEFSQWSSKQRAELLILMRDLTESLHNNQLKECQSAEWRKCPLANAPANGGLVCATAANRTFCKPMCNSGHDFAFLRRSRLFDECSEQTNYKWNSQYGGGTRLAVCNKESIQISGAKSAYFPNDCLTTRSSDGMQRSIFGNFTSELKDAGITEDPQHLCLICGPN
ncbi:uncharacterized protein si:ch1073-126c3.2 [Nothobranchius furzeri]|uniref:LOC107376133-like protein n=1 Tax=Nothobranchius furzeri TaxID=105023 RepID=A0A8C6MCW6_NOTFU|nr:uncharacterized protein si:ch1073-126c3.2 [Nothobranchius furzeri]KAF7220545.1 putative LOC107376133-like protein [Nothobranchius furzeri]